MSKIGGENSATESAVIPHWYNPEGSRLTLTDGEGVTVFDLDGNTYLDFTSQLYCVNNEAIIDAMTEQSRRLPYVSSAKDNDKRTELAERLGEIAPGNLSDVVFSISGSEANELAIQFAREYTDATKILTRYQSYHGSTYAAGALTGDPDTRAPIESHGIATGFAKFFPPLPSCFDAESPSELAEKAADHVEFVIRNEGPDTVAAILMEPIAGSSGAYPAPPGYFERLREICDEYDVLLIADEVITGFGRCGEWFGMQTEGVVPDMMTFAKGVTSSYSPLGGVITRPEIGASLREGVSIGQTFAGHPVACAAGLAAIDEYENHLLANAQEQSEVLERQLEELQASHDVVASVRGRGLLWSVLFRDTETGEPFVAPAIGDEPNPVDDVVAAARENGTLLSVGRPQSQIIIAPPLCVDEPEIEAAIASLDEAITSVFN